MKLLWISPRWPIPADGGSKIATLQLLQAISKDPSLELHLVAMVPESEGTPTIPQVQCKSLNIIHRKISSGSHLFRLLFAPHVPVTFHSFLESGLKNQLEKIIKSQNWDAVVFDGLHAAIPFSFSSTRAALFYRAHNVEYRLWEQTAEKHSFLKKIAIQFQAKQVKKFEKLTSEKCKKVFSISIEDDEIFKKLCPSISSQVIRVGQNFSSEPPARTLRTRPVLGFIGRLDWLPNREGLEWFLKNVWPKVQCQRPELTLKIAGSGNSDWIKPFFSQPGLQFLGKVESLDAFYESIDLSIVPIFLGSGLRVKVVEASKYSIPVLSTQLGAEGSGLTKNTQYYSGETAEEWTKILNEIQTPTLNAMGKQAFFSMKELYDQSVIGSTSVKDLKAESLNSFHLKPLE